MDMRSLCKACQDYITPSESKMYDGFCEECYYKLSFKEMEETEDNERTE